MKLATNVVLFCACALIVWGGFGLIAAWIAPRLRRSRLLGSKMFVGRLAPTRLNLTLMSLWGIVFGVFLASSVLQSQGVFWASFIILVPLVTWLMLRRSRSGREA